MYYQNEPFIYQSNYSYYPPIYESRYGQEKWGILSSNPLSYSNYQDYSGMITDMEYLNFPLDLQYHKYQLKKRSHIKDILSIKTTKVKDPKSIFFLSLLENLQTEKQLEEMRKKLVLQQDFNIPSIFNIIDSNGSDNMSFSEFFNGLQSIGLNATEESMYLIYCRFQQVNAKETMSLNEFSKIFLPLGNVRQTVMDQRYNYLPQQNTLKLMGELMTLYRQSEMKFEYCRKTLADLGADYGSIFSVIDKNGSRRIGLQEFIQALNAYSSNQISNIDATLLFCRFDKSGDGTVTLMEFKKEMEYKLQ